MEGRVRVRSGKFGCVKASEAVAEWYAWALLGFLWSVLDWRSRCVVYRLDGVSCCLPWRS
jgi:hypothetical protein